MFYAAFTPEKRARLREALDALRDIFGRVYANDNLIALSRYTGFLDDERFMRAVARNARGEKDRSLKWRLHTLVWAVDHCLHVEGDFVECGVFYGFSSSVLADYFDFGKIDKTFYLYDTFSGIPEQYDSEHRREAQAVVFPPDLYEIVVEKFAPYDNVVVVKGIVPDTFATTVPDKIAFCHIDMNAAAAEIAALEHLFDRVSPGGVIVFDDYGWRAYTRQSRAEDAFMAARGYRILELPTGQGMVLKR